MFHTQKTKFEQFEQFEHPLPLTVQTINYNQLYRNWITSNDWHKRHKDWRQLYAWDREVRKPEPPARTYQAEWVPAVDRNP